MQTTPLSIPGIKLLKPDIHGDDRGYFFESFRQEYLDKIIPGINFVQDNESRSSKGVLRGLHYQLPPMAQSKLVRVIEGEVLDVAVDLRKGSITFGEHVEIILSAENKHQLFIPRGFAHGFIVLSETAIFSYKVDNYYSTEHERGIMYNDKTLKINWHLSVEDIVTSSRDSALPEFKDAAYFEKSMELYS